MPREDALAVGQDAIAVADGITRDPPGVPDFSGLAIEKILKYYPTISGGALAAQLFCHRFIKHFNTAPTDERHVEKAFSAANQAIAELNTQRVPRIDYLVNDYFACSAVGGLLEDDRLYWGCIGDSGLIVFDKLGQRKLRTPDGMQNFRRYEPELELDWNKPGSRRLVRSQFRNNPNKIVDGEREIGRAHV